MTTPLNLFIQSMRRISESPVFSDGRISIEEVIDFAKGLEKMDQAGLEVAYLSGAQNNLYQTFENSEDYFKQTYPKPE